MALIVQKFGGTSVKNAERLRNVAGIITDTYKAGNKVVAVVSAQGDFTDELIEKAAEVNSDPSKREMDQLLTAGEQISAALLAMTIESMGCPVISLLGWQAGFETNSAYGAARIKRVDTQRLTRELDRGGIVIVTGFQGINKYDDMTTLGRGGSDTSAVAIAAALGADSCQIYTDVDGVYTADPRKVEGAVKLNVISYDEMLELASLGAQVLNNRSVEMAKKYRVQIEVLSSLKRVPGTVVREVSKMEKLLVSGVTKDSNVAKIAIIGVRDTPGMAFRIFNALAAKKIVVDVILQSIGRDGTKDIAFTVSESDADAARAAVSAVPELAENKIEMESDIAKVSVVGAGMESHQGIAAKVFEALYDENINIRMINTSEIKISVIINEEDADRAVKAIHDKFEPFQ